MLDFARKESVCVITDTEPDRLSPLAPPAPMGLRGVWVVAARCCANPMLVACVPQAMASIIDNPNGSGQSIGDRGAPALPRNSRSWSGGPSCRVSRSWKKK